MKTKIILITLLTMLSFGTKLTAQTSTFSKVTFNNNNLKMAGNLYLPKDFNENKKHPVIITVHPGGGVKEQTSGLYAQKMAEQGYVALAFDASHQGESEGLPRFLEDPTERVEDIRSAVDYVTTLKFVDTEKIGLIGICAGGGYSINAAQTEHRIKAVAIASPVSTGNKKGWDGKTPVLESLKTLEVVAQQRTAEANGAEPMYVNYVPEKPDANTPNDLVEAYDYYRTPRAQHPNSTNLLLFTSLDKMMAFEAFANIETFLTQPTLIIVGNKAGSRWQGEEVYKKITSPKELVIIDGATHMDLYDIPKYVKQVAENMTAFFEKNL
ncbi:alpha/beta hydrolase [Flavobacterium sp. XS2P12]|uniref:alpha/beta hydrolase n=1 Tax=Flavobacterium melibiosi TaxID=3398734 RepID=UPI003A8C4327